MSKIFKYAKSAWLILFLFMLPNVITAQPVTLVTLGDSLTAGDGDDGVGGGYPARLLHKLKAKHPGSVLKQFAISGDTTTDLINKQLTPAISALDAAPSGHTKIAIVWIGSNDLFGFYNYTIGEEWCSKMGTAACENSEFTTSADNIKKILSKLKATGALLYIALLDDQSKRPVITNLSLRAQAFPNITDAHVARMKKQITTYNSSIKTHAATYGAKIVDFCHTKIFENRATLSSDGNHPNGIGYDAIADLWHKRLKGN